MDDFKSRFYLKGDNPLYIIDYITEQPLISLMFVQNKGSAHLPRPVILSSRNPTSCSVLEDDLLVNPYPQPSFFVLSLQYINFFLRVLRDLSGENGFVFYPSCPSNQSLSLAWICAFR